MSVEEAFTSRRVILIVAHPDDETIGAGGLLQQLNDALIVVVTDGAPRNLIDAREAGFERYEDYAQARWLELQNAMELAGVRPDQLRCLSVPDQEASLNLPELSRRIGEILRSERPGTVLTHPYEGGHPDHDATAFAVHAGCALLPVAPDIHEFTSYHAKDGAMEVGRFLPDGEPGECTQLSNEGRERKRKMIECFATQERTLRCFPLDVECFRPAPAYDFTQAPHAGELFYEKFPWGMTGEKWRELAAVALKKLSLTATL